MHLPVDVIKEHAPLKTFPCFAWENISHSVSDIDDETSRGQWWQGDRLHYILTFLTEEALNLKEPLTS